MYAGYGRRYHEDTLLTVEVGMSLIVEGEVNGDTTTVSSRTTIEVAKQKTYRS